MRIEQFSYYDKSRNWRLNPVNLSNFNLLVGVSGVGKTKIIQAIDNLKMIVNGVSFNGIEWDVTFLSNDGIEYQWQGEFATFKDKDEYKADKNEIIRESLYKNGECLLKRENNTIYFKGQLIPKLSANKSMINLLDQEEDIIPFKQELNKIIYSRILLLSSFSSPFSIPGDFSIQLREQSDDLLKKSMIEQSNLGALTKLAATYIYLPKIFEEIKNNFIDIFASVEDIKFDKYSFENRYDNELLKFTNISLPLLLKEKGSDDWIESDSISSGMLKTLLYLTELYLSPAGSVILIDQFEDSLGVNCLDLITDELLNDDKGLQFIITSHHPYIINNVSMDYWKIVTRRGGVVTIKDAKELGFGKSKHQAFIQLINNAAYREGITVE